MSHIRSNLNPDGRLFESVSDRPLPSVTATAPGPLDVAKNEVWPVAVPGWLRAFRSVAAILRTWRARRRARRELAAIDVHTLWDIGLAPELIEYEISQPFWRPLRNWRD